MLVVPLLVRQQKAGLGELESKGTAPDTGREMIDLPPGAGMNQHEGPVISGEARARAPEERVPARLTSLCAERPQGSSAWVHPAPQAWRAFWTKGSPF